MFLEGIIFSKQVYVKRSMGCNFVCLRNPLRQRQDLPQMQRLLVAEGSLLSPYPRSHPRCRKQPHPEHVSSPGIAHIQLLDGVRNNGTAPWYIPSLNFDPSLDMLPMRLAEATLWAQPYLFLPHKPCFWKMFTTNFFHQVLQHRWG